MKKRILDRAILTVAVLGLTYILLDPTARADTDVWQQPSFEEQEYRQQQQAEEQNYRQQERSRQELEQDQRDWEAAARRLNAAQEGVNTRSSDSTFDFLYGLGHPK